MKIATIVLAGTAALSIGSAALAEQGITGMVTKVDRINGTVAIQRTQSGTVGANAAGTAEEFKVQAGTSLEEVHAGDRVTFSTTDTGGTSTITKIGKQ